MLQSASGRAASARKSAGQFDGDVEIYVGDKGDGFLLLSSSPPSGSARSVSRELRPLFSGGRYGEAGGPWLFCVGLAVPSADRDEFLSWYEEEHLPMLLECEQWDGCRFVESPASIGCQFFALHQLKDRAALDSEARARSRSTDWFKALAREHSWFDGPFTRNLYVRDGTST